MRIIDDGWIIPTFTDRDGNEVQGDRFDCFQVYNRICTIIDQNQDTEEQHNQISQIMQELGFPTPSHRVAVQFYKSLSDRVEELAKKKDTDDDAPGSSDSTARAS